MDGFYAEHIFVSTDMDNERGSIEATHEETMNPFVVAAIVILCFIALVVPFVGPYLFPESPKPLYFYLQRDSLPTWLSPYTENQI